MKKNTMKKNTMKKNTMKKNKNVDFSGQFVTINGDWYTLMKMYEPKHLPKIKPMFEVAAI